MNRETTDQPDSSGVAPTNDPRTHVLWERRGRQVVLTLHTTREPAPRWDLPAPAAS